jgi:ABC-type sugar transport system ATPase subunit
MSLSEDSPRPVGTGRATPVLVATGLTKLFPGVRALDAVDFDIAAGEIVALLGQNGAGKSTLIQIFAGVHPAKSYSGHLTLVGRPYAPSGVAAAEAAGVALVPQEVNIIPDLSVAENITLNDEPRRWGMIDVAGRLDVARRALASFGLAIEPQVPMSTLDLASQQLVVIARALAKRVRLLILDEPTAALTEKEAEKLFDMLRALKVRGVAVVFVSHRLSEIFAIADRIVVMRDGRIRGRHVAADVSRAEIIAEMIGDAAETERGDKATTVASVALEIRDLNLSEASGRPRVKGLSLTVGAGETVGLFGLLGAGCIEAALATCGAYPGRREGRILVQGRDVVIASPVDAVALGIGLIAQDRRDCLIGDQSIYDNISIASLARIVRRGWLDVALGRRRAQDQTDALNVKASSIDVEVRTLSGGNQQKVQIGRWLAAEARILVMIDPTRGVDVGARRDIKRIWQDLARRGHALFLASTDVEELVDTCDRVIVLAGGRMVGELAGSDLNERNLVRMATDG